MLPATYQKMQNPSGLVLLPPLQQGGAGQAGATPQLYKLGAPTKNPKPMMPSPYLQDASLWHRQLARKATSLVQAAQAGTAP